MKVDMTLYVELLEAEVKRARGEIARLNALAEVKAMESEARQVKLREPMVHVDGTKIHSREGAETVGRIIGATNSALMGLMGERSP